MKSFRKVSPLDNFDVYRPSAKAMRRAADWESQVEADLTPRQKTLSWICRLVAAAIMIETLFFKFTGAPESIYIFSKMGLESWWRYGQGIWELLASILLLTPRFGWAGAMLTLGAIGAAIISHLTVLGIAVQGDHGLLFAMALVTFSCGFIVMYLHRHEIPGYAPMTPY
ncbi:MAG: DoxX family protein [Verrucomicrobiota bacterium]